MNAKQITVAVIAVATAFAWVKILRDSEAELAAMAADNVRKEHELLARLAFVSQEIEVLKSQEIETLKAQSRAGRTILKVVK